MNMTPEILIRLLSLMKEIPEDSSTWPPEWLTISYKDYEQSLRVPLNTDTLASLEDSQREITSLIAKRTSGSHFNKPLSPEEIFFLLSSASREKNKETKQRMYPSGGARYPLELYFVQQGRGIIPCGTYHFSQVNNELTRIKTFSEESEDIFEKGHSYYGMTSYLTITYLPERNNNKYGYQGISLAYVEAGTLLQNISLLATALSIQTRILAGFSDTRVRDRLDLGKNEEFPLLLVAISK